MLTYKLSPRKLPLKRMGFTFQKLIIFRLCVVCVLSYDYCNIQNDCPENTRHIGCYPEQLGHLSENATKIPMTKKLRNSIISVHNEYRNELSCGLVEDVNKIPFPPAAKMRELKWDNELEYLAGLHVQHCTVAQDECRITSRFKLVGQNVGAIIGCVPNIGGLQIGAATNEILRQWFNEHLGATYRSSDEFQSEPQTDQFFQMINDKTARVGCALALCSFNTTDNILLLTCNYSYKTVNDEAVYTAGAIVTKCDRANSRPSANYRCLCEAADS